MTTTEACSFLRKHDFFLLLTHKRPDGDTLGSAGALALALRRIGKTAYLYKNPQITDKYIGYVDSLFAPEDFTAQTVVAVDIADTGLLPAGSSGMTDLCIDHHPTNSFYAENTLVFPERSSCGEVVLALIKELCENLTAEEADLLYIAVSTDTGCFQYSNTDAETHRAAAELISAGCNAASLNKALFRSSSPARIMLEGLIFSSLRSEMDGKINIAVVTLEMMEKSGASEDDCDDLASLPGRVAGNIVSAVIREVSPNRCKVSARSGGSVNVSAICARFGGGGHLAAAGCELDGTPDDVASLFIKLYKEALT